MITDPKLYETASGVCPVQQSCGCEDTQELLKCDCGHWACEYCCTQTIYEDGRCVLTCDDCPIPD